MFCTEHLLLAKRLWLQNSCGVAGKKIDELKSWFGCSSDWASPILSLYSGPKLMVLHLGGGSQLIVHSLYCKRWLLAHRSNAKLFFLGWFRVSFLLEQRADVIWPSGWGRRGERVAQPWLCVTVPTGGSSVGLTHSVMKVGSWWHSAEISLALQPDLVRSDLLILC